MSFAGKAASWILPERPDRVGAAARTIERVTQNPGGAIRTIKVCVRRNITSQFMIGSSPLNFCFPNRLQVGNAGGPLRSASCWNETGNGNRRQEQEAGIAKSSFLLPNKMMEAVITNEIAINTVSPRSGLSASHSICTPCLTGLPLMNAPFLRPLARCDTRRNRRANVSAR